MSDSTPSRRRFLELGGAALAASLAGCSASAPGQDATTTESDTGTTTATDPESGSDSVYTEVYRNAVDSVVMVRADQGQGTGFAFDDSHVVTNAHVVGDAESVNVRFAQGEWSEGEVVGTDAHSDLAAVEVGTTPSSASALPFAEADPAIGQEVVAIGNPYDLNGSLTTGVVSGTDRSIPAPTGYRIPDAVQTDAAVNPGNSGGPLMSVDGRVVAVINSGGGDNIGFGISSALTRRVVPRLIETGEYEHSFVGVSFTNVTPTIAEANDLDEPRGLIVTRVVEGGPSEGVLRAGETETVDGRRVPVGGDVLLAIGDAELETSEDLGSYLALRTRPGETVELTVLRDASERTVELELGSRPENPGA
ncbi:trypsin-like peptidase domain-containing protein [Halorussus salilacus]|uniref:S1C family serine protease n=1 Tax=Halorussus salilacus TaxID=2953750 RepID=UPI0020A1B9B6|nr:trypsin-like peptidase domain-containing protein [Halorussus salilacus]USZ67824.1 trypsin-like peptidase domain-containing protein [Halorussus salilacus]